LRALDALAAAVLAAVQVAAGALDVALAGDRDDDLFLRDEVFHRDVAVEAVHDLRAAVVAVLVDDRGELGLDDVALADLARDDLLEVRDLRLELGGLVDDLLALQGGEATQLHRQDRVGLDVVDLEQILQALAGLVDRRRTADQRDDLVERVERLEVAAQDVHALLGLAQAELRAADDDLELVGDPQRDEAVERERARHAVDDRQHVRREVRLQVGVLVEVVEHD